MKIRYAEVFDAFIITKIHCDTWQKCYANLIPQEILQKRVFSQERVLRWENRIKEQKQFVLVAENDEGIVTGFVWGGIGREEKLPYQYELYALYVDDKAQGEGYGSALINAFAKEIKSDFYLFALKGNEKAKRFYLKNGGLLKPEFSKTQQEGDIFLEEECFVFLKE